MHNYENVNSAELLLTATTDKSMLIINWAGISTRTSTKTATKRTKKAAYLTIALGDVGVLDHIVVSGTDHVSLAQRGHL